VVHRRAPCDSGTATCFVEMEALVSVDVRVKADLGSGFRASCCTGRMSRRAQSRSARGWIKQWPLRRRCCRHRVLQAAGCRFSRSSPDARLAVARPAASRRHRLTPLLGMCRWATYRRRRHWRPAEAGTMAGTTASRSCRVRRTACRRRRLARARRPRCSFSVNADAAHDRFDLDASSVDISQ